MLVLSRHVDQRILIGDDIWLSVVAVSGHRVRIGIEAPPHIKVLREEVIGKEPNDHDSDRRAGQALDQPVQQDHFLTEPADNGTDGGRAGAADDGGTSTGGGPGRTESAEAGPGATEKGSDTGASSGTDAGTKAGKRQRGPLAGRIDGSESKYPARRQTKKRKAD